MKTEGFSLTSTESHARGRGPAPLRCQPGSPVVVLTVDGSAPANWETLVRLRRSDTRQCDSCHGSRTFRDYVARKPNFDNIDVTGVTGLGAPNLTWDTVKRLSAPQSGSCSQGASSSRQDGLSSPSSTSEEAPFAVRATTCDDAPFVFRASLPVKSPISLLRCGDSNRPRVPRGVLWSSADPFVPPSPVRAGCVIGSRGDHRRDRTVAIDRISHGTIQSCEFRRWGLSL